MTRRLLLFFPVSIGLLGICCSGSHSGEPGVPVVVDFAHPLQTISGFGAANILPYRPDMTAEQVKKAFGTDSGQVGLSILRLSIPTERSEFARNVPTAKLAHEMGVTIVASPWTPPPSMKTNHDTAGGALADTSYASYAAHLESFCDYMAENGAPLYAVSIQNEPDITVKYASCDWSASEMLKFVKYYAPAIGTRIIAPESFNFDRTISDSLLNDSVADSHVSIIGGHLYGEGVKGLFFSMYMSVMGGGHIFGKGLDAYPLAIDKGKEVWMTEHLAKDTSWAGALGTAKEIHDCMCAEMSAYLWWYVVRYYGPILENGEISKRGYAMSQYARFVRPGFVRVRATSEPQEGVYVTSYARGPKLTIIAINTGDSVVEQAFVLRNGTAASVVPYVTSLTKNCLRANSLTISEGRFNASLEPSSITTFVAE